MPELPTLTPEEQAHADNLAHTKMVTRDRIVSHMNSVGANLINAYPMAEVQSWTIQRDESERVATLEEVDVLALSEIELGEICPFIISVCVAHYGPVEEFATRAQQAWTKSLQVKANADLWAALSAFVNGLRARMEDLIGLATTIEGVLEVERAIQGELGAFRKAYGV